MNPIGFKINAIRQFEVESKQEPHANFRPATAEEILRSEGLKKAFDLVCDYMHKRVPWEVVSNSLSEKLGKIKERYFDPI